MQNNATKMIKFIFFLSFLTCLVGCGTSSPQPVVKKKEVPAWVNSVLSNDDSLYMYGLGIASNREGAVKAALNDVVSRLGTTIESSYESIQKVDGAYANLKTKSNIRADVSKIKINNYKVIKSYKLSYKEFAVMVAVDKMKFINGLKTELTIKKKSIKEALLAVERLNAIERYNRKKELFQQAKSLFSSIYILIELDPSFDKKSNFEFIFWVNKLFINEAQKLRFSVHGNEKSVKFIEKIKNYLAQHGFRVVSSKKGSVNIVLNVSDNISEDYVLIAVLNLNIAVYDGQKRVGGKTLIVKERYNNSIESVYKNASIHFEQEIQDEGISSVLGINLQL